MKHNSVAGGIKELLDLRNRLLKASKVIARETARITHREVVKQIHSMDLIASGSFLQSITTGTISSPFSSTFETSIRSSSAYADNIEEGRRPGKWPPPDRIFNWMVYKGLEPSLQAVYAISRKIAREGIPAKRPFAKGIDEAMPRIRVRAEIEIDEALQGSRFGVDFG